MAWPWQHITHFWLCIMCLSRSNVPETSKPTKSLAKQLQSGYSYNGRERAAVGLRWIKKQESTAQCSIYLRHSPHLFFCNKMHLHLAINLKDLFILLVINDVNLSYILAVTLYFYQEPVYFRLIYDIFRGHSHVSFDSFQFSFWHCRWIDLSWVCFSTT